MGKFERKFGKYAVKNLALILIIFYGVGYVLYLVNPAALNYLTLDPYAIVHGQVWRLISWILVPPTYSFNFLTLIMLMFYYSIGKTLERAWGDFLFNVYVFSGMLFTIVGSFLAFGFFALQENPTIILGSNYIAGLPNIMLAMSMFFSTYYINLSIFLAFALTFPDAQVWIWFLFPVKMKWLGIIDGLYIVYEFIVGTVFTKLAIGASLLNFVIFFFITRRKRLGSPKQRMQRAAQSREFRNSVRRETTPKGVSKHKCAICGRTELTNPELQFRFCSKCNGNYEYCNEHLFNHKHVE